MPMEAQELLEDEQKQPLNLKQIIRLRIESTALPQFRPHSLSVYELKLSYTVQALARCPVGGFVHTQR